MSQCAGSAPHSLHDPAVCPPDPPPGHGGGLLHLRGEGGVRGEDCEGDREATCQDLRRRQAEDEAKEEDPPLDRTPGPWLLHVVWRGSV